MKRGRGQDRKENSKELRGDRERKGRAAEVEERREMKKG